MPRRSAADPGEGTGGEARAGEPIRVGFLVHALEVAGAETLVAEIIGRLGERLQPAVLCLDRIGALGERLAEGGLDVEVLGRRPGRDLRLPGRLASAVRRRRLELLHAHQYTPFFYAALAKPMLRAAPRLVFTEHGRHYPDVVSTARRWTNRLLLARLADAVTGCSEFSRRALADNDGFDGGKIEVIPNGVRVEGYGRAPDREAARRRLDLRPDRRYAVCVARFHPVKDHATLLRAYARVARARHDADLLLVGDGELRLELEALAWSLGVDTRVRFLGVRQDVPALLGAADLFVLASLSEAASLTLLEAMASGLPVVATAVGGTPELVRHGREGLLVGRGDDAAAAQAMLTVLGDEEAAAEMGRAGWRRVAAEFRLGRTVDLYHDLYRRLCRGGDGG